jgi:ornithine lipid ester-linked acyl 2-hydroxylase
MMEPKGALRKPVPILDFQRKLIERFDPDAGVRFFDKSRFPWVSELEAGWKTMRRDLDEALEERGQRIPKFTDVSSRQKGLADDQWKTLVFYFYGRRVRENCDRYPETEALLKRIPQMRTAMFSILDGGAHIPAHHGPYKGILRYHLGLRVPATGDACCIRVDNEIRSWGEGDSLIFDDTFEHEVWNRDPRQRVVLFVDFLRPMAAPLSQINWALSHIIEHAGVVREVQDKAAQYAKP